MAPVPDQDAVEPRSDEPQHDEPQHEETQREEAAPEGALAGPGPARGRRRVRPRTIAVAVVLLALLGAVGLLGFQVRQAQVAEGQRGAVLGAARRYAVDLSSYDHTALERNFQKVSANASGRFAEQYERISTALTELIRQQQAKSEGFVLEAGLVEMTGERAVVALFVDQKITNLNSPEPRIDRTRMRMTLQREGDRWLVDDIRLV
ncbi:hypothetical protein [Saccharopolyspora cebuensis]|uniref:Mce-associated membrane protein n=1 Tax=Saccharopolyspora cebuensis TaxID=418759 RepID=A0ABV4CPR1_9PSEU